MVKGQDAPFTAESPAEGMGGDEDGCVQVHIVKTAKPHGKMGREGHSQDALHHPAHHELQPRRSGKAPHADGLYDTAFHELDIDGPHRFSLDQFKDIAGAAGRLIGTDGDGKMLGQVCHAVNIFPGKGLLKKLEGNSLPLGLFKHGEGPGQVIAAVGIGYDTGFRRRVAYGLQALHIFPG